MTDSDLNILISLINPKYSSKTDKIKKLIAEKVFRDVLKVVKDENIAPKPDEEHQLVYDSATETLEPVYFWILDKTSDFFGSGNVEKFVDNFVSSPGSGHFSELMGKATKMQEESMKAMGMVNQLIKAIINLVYDLKNFQTRIADYDRANSKSPDDAKAGTYSLKQIWMDNVDIKRGNTSIKGLASQFDYTTLIDAFMIANSPKEASDMDLNERVKRILEARLAEFLDWRNRSEKEIRQRYEIEKTYLKSELASLKLYTRWAKPYLKAAAELEQTPSGRRPEIVKAFNTIRLELALLGKRPVDIEGSITAHELPAEFRKIKDRLKRKYYACIAIDFNFRGIPQRIGQGYVYGGRTEVTFKAYALNDDEITMLKDKFDETDVADALKLVETATGESLGQIQTDINFFLEEKPKEPKKEEKPENVNPFLALFGIGKKKEETEKKTEAPEKPVPIKEIKPDSHQEALLRKIAVRNAQEACFNIFDIYKKAHGMPSHVAPEFGIEPSKKTKFQKFLGL
jgi:hypothetical protein